MFLETLLLIGSCHDKPTTTEGVLHLAHKSWIFGNLEVGIKLREFHLVFMPSLRVVDKCTIENTFICPTLCNCLLAVANRFTGLYSCWGVSWRICKVARMLHSSWMNFGGT